MEIIGFSATILAIYIYMYVYIYICIYIYPVLLHVDTDSIFHYSNISYYNMNAILTQKIMLK